MALLLHGRHSEYFKAVVDIFGRSDFFFFIYKQCSRILEAHGSVGWKLEQDREKLDFSPITHIDGMTKPMLCFIQGRK